MATFLLELFGEEIPARMQRPAAQQLEDSMRRLLDEARLSYGKIEQFVTPRRLAIRVHDLPERQEDLTVERKGPRANAPEQAIEGFCRSTGLSRDRLELRGDTYFANIHAPGQPTAEALRAPLETLLQQFHWPKSMRWGSGEISWVRPLHSICCLLDDAVVPLSFSGLTAGNTTRGHRFHAPDAIAIPRPEAYEQVLESVRVMPSSQERERRILEQAEAMAKAQGLTLRNDPYLLEEVTGLVEWPVVLMGSIDAAHMGLPPEVLVSVMRAHQKYLLLLDAKGNLAPHFLIVANLEASDGGTAIIHGNERVLRARLEDGRFYWDQDRARNLSAWGEKLDGMVFHAALGDMQAKVRRLKDLVSFVAIYVPDANLIAAERAAELCKADLTSGMVGQFPELQGVMGRYYAINQDEAPEVAEAIRDHHAPQGPQTPCPTAPVTVAVALADKLDNLAGLFAAGEKPTGSKDPFALRRAALGLVRLILENGLRLPLGLAYRAALKKYDASLFKKQSLDEVAEELVAFTRERFRVMLREDGIRHDLVAAVLDHQHRQQDDLLRLGQRIKHLERFLASEDGMHLLAGYKRASNILQIEEKKDKRQHRDSVATSQLQETAEKELYARLHEVTGVVAQAAEAEKDAEGMAALASLRQPIDRFFDEVTVNAPDPALRDNRLRLLAAILRVMQELADFAQLEGSAAAGGEKRAA